jgi:hypothetical protein
VIAKVMVIREILMKSVHRLCLHAVSFHKSAVFHDYFTFPCFSNSSQPMMYTAADNYLK